MKRKKSAAVLKIAVVTGILCLSKFEAGEIIK